MLRSVTRESIKVLSDWTVEDLSGEPTEAADCNADGMVDAGAMAAEIPEVFDGDGSEPDAVPGGTFAGQRDRLQHQRRRRSGCR